MSILYHRVRAHLSQEELAEKIGVPEGRIRNYEKGRLFPDPELDRKLAEFFQVPVGKLKRETAYPRLTKEGLVKGMNARETLMYLRGLSKYLGERGKPVLPPDFMRLLWREKRREYTRRRAGDMRNPADGNGKANAGARKKRLRTRSRPPRTPKTRGGLADNGRDT